MCPDVSTHVVFRGMKAGQAWNVKVAEDNVCQPNFCVRCASSVASMLVSPVGFQLSSASKCRSWSYTRVVHGQLWGPEKVSLKLIKEALTLLNGFQQWYNTCIPWDFQRPRTLAANTLGCLGPQHESWKVACSLATVYTTVPEALNLRSSCGSWKIAPLVITGGLSTDW